MLRVGVDVGGTNTDAVVLFGNTVLGISKSTSTKDVVTGVGHALESCLSKAKIDPQHVSACMLGTTQFINSLIEHKDLSKVLTLRLCGPWTRSLPPFAQFPTNMRENMGGHYMFLDGGYEYDGVREITPINREQVREAAGHLLRHGISSVVVSGVFSPVNPQQELAVGEMLKEEWASLEGGLAGREELFITLSHKIGHLGLLERENAAILNAALGPLARRVIPRYREALHEVGMTNARLFLTANDGTLMGEEVALELPLFTIQSGPVNSMRGAAYLHGGSADDIVVMDIGGTTTDVGTLAHGLPRPANKMVTLCGVTTNLAMPDVVSIGLGGGSKVTWAVEETPGAPSLGICQVGALSVGADIERSCITSGGPTLTTTDVAVLLGHMECPWDTKWDTDMCQAVRLNNKLDQKSLEEAWQVIQSKLSAQVDLVKHVRGDVPLVVVGGGAALCGDRLEGTSTVSTVTFGEVANAVGAAIAQVSGTIDVLVNMEPSTSPEGRARRQDHLDLVKQQAIQQAVERGAVEGTCKVVQCEEVPMSYLPGAPTRVMVKVVGDLKVPEAPADLKVVARDQKPPGRRALVSGGLAATPLAVKEALSTTYTGEGRSLNIVSPSSQPTITPEGYWKLSPQDVEALAIGAQILGTGGGGSAEHGRLELLREMERGNIPLVMPLSLLNDDALVVDCGGMGAPTVSVEKMSGDEVLTAVRALQHTLVPSFGSSEGSEGVVQKALICGEIGGGNCLGPLVVGAKLGIPIVDADLMGRAFPELQMMTSSIYGVPLTPMSLADMKGNVLIMREAGDDLMVERVMRAVCDTLGGTVGVATTPMTGETVKKVGIKNSVSLAWRLGQAVMTAQREKLDPVAAVLRAYNKVQGPSPSTPIHLPCDGGGGGVLVRGKVVDVVRNTSEGFVKGWMLVEGSGRGGWGQLFVEFQNENLLAYWKLGSPHETATTDETRAYGVPRGSPELTLPPGGEGVPLPGPAPLPSTRSTHDLVACTPDLICCLETASGLAVATDELRYGLRVSVVVLPAPPLLRTPEALKVVGPQAFGYEAVYVPVGEFQEHCSICDAWGPPGRRAGRGAAA